jgi:molybdenum cofactor cytidylyltransferase
MLQPGPVVGLILAAGAATRFGCAKQLLPLGGEPLIRHTLRRALAAELHGVIVVVGASATEVAAAVADLPVSVVVNPDFAVGQSTSLRAGVEAASAAGSSAVVVLLADQPEIQSGAIAAVVDGHRRTGALIVQATYGGTPSHPVLFARKLFPELLQVTGDEGARAVIQRHADDRLRVEVDAGSPPPDIDTEQDYRALLDRWKRRSTDATPATLDSSVAGAGTRVKRDR